MSQQFLQQQQHHQQQQPSSLSQFSLSQLPSLGQIPIGLTTPSGPAYSHAPAPTFPMHMGQIPQLYNPLADMTPSLSQLSSSMMMPMGGAFTSYAPPIHQQLQQETVLPKPMMAPPKASLPVFSEVEYNDDNSCIICYEDMKDHNSLRLECGHRFHKAVSHTYTVLCYIVVCFHFQSEMRHFSCFKLHSIVKFYYCRTYTTYCTILYYTVLILYYTVYCTNTVLILYYTVLILYYTVLYCTNTVLILYYTVLILYYTVLILYYTVLIL